MKLPYSSENLDDMYVYRTTPGDKRGFRYIPQQGASEKLVFYIKDSAGKWVPNQPGAVWANHTAFRNYSQRGDLHSLELSFEGARDMAPTRIEFTRENPGPSMTASPNSLPYSDPNDMYVYTTDTGEKRGFKYIPQQGASEKLVF